MERSKPRGIAFAAALRALRDGTGRLEASFASKLVATLNPDMPVIDRYVLGNFGLRLPTPSHRDREGGVIEVYDQLCEKYAALMQEEIAATICRKFDRRYPWAVVTNLKKIDLVLWQIRPAVDSGRTGDRPRT